MNQMVRMNCLKRILLVGWMSGTVQLASAMNYSNTDLLLVFRKDGFNDVEFDLGSVSNYVGLAQGTQKTISYDTNLVASNFNGSVTDASFLLVAATGQGDPNPRLWLSDVSASPDPTDVTLSKFSQIRSKIGSIGLQGSIYTTSNSLPVVTATSLAGSYTFVASDGNLTPASSLGGLTAFPIESAGGGTLRFFELHISTTTPKPAATLIGKFAMDNTGVITFTAGTSTTVTGPTVTGFVRNGTTSTLSFSSIAGIKYQLGAATNISGPFALVGDALTGNGSTQSLSETSSEPVRFYRIQASN